MRKLETHATHTVRDMTVRIQMDQASCPCSLLFLSKVERQVIERRMKKE